MELLGNKFYSLVYENKDGDRIPNGTEYRVYDSNNIYVMTVGVIRTTVVYNIGAINPVDVPVDLYSDKYTFKRQGN